jgi:hypothetical protein
MSIMQQQYKLAVGQLLSKPNHVRAIIILGTLLIAALAGGAPNDFGG